MVHRDHLTVVYRQAIEVEDWAVPFLPLIKPLFRIETHMKLEERFELFRLAVLLPEGFVACEVGSYLGASSSLLAAVASRRKGHLHAVDTWSNDHMGDDPIEDTFARFQENTQSVRQFITSHRGLATTMKDQVPEIDLLFIDGDHSYQGVRENLLDYGPKIKSGGLLVMHDFDYQDVQRALVDTYPPNSLKLVNRVEALQSFQVV